MIKDLDIVALAHDFPEQGLTKGDLGTVVIVDKDGEAYEVEFMTPTGTTIGLVALEANDVRPNSEREIANARQVA